MGDAGTESVVRFSGDLRCAGVSITRGDLHGAGVFASLLLLIFHS